MKCIHSLWTGTPTFHPRRGPLLVHLLSLCLAQRHFARVEFVTDFRGLELVETLGFRYTNVRTTLEHALPDPGLKHIWALGKSVALLAQKEPCVQIDTDVLLFKPLNPRILRSRLCAQSIDYPCHYQSPEMGRALAVARFPGDHTAYNCGIVGGTDLRLLHEYAGRTLRIARRFQGVELTGTVISMCIEQYGLAVVAGESGVRVETVCSVHPSDAEVARVGYAHLQGGAKHDPKWVAAVEARLAKDFPEEYARFLSGWEDVSAGYGPAPMGSFR